jgi:hypothetical protein
MIEQWFSTIELPMTMAQFWQLPRNPAYKYEYAQGRAWLSPRPKTCRAVLELASLPRPVLDPSSREEFAIRPLGDEDWQSLPPLFSSALGGTQPFAGLSDEDGLRAAQSCLDQTRSGGDGPLIAEACHVATELPEQEVIGAVLTTLVPETELSDWRSWEWRSPPPADAVARRLGRPHLTWIFASPWHTGRGLGMVLLDAAAQGLLRLGYTQLVSTFLLGNESSTLWHWRAGFRLLPRLGSRRAV